MEIFVVARELGFPVALEAAEVALQLSFEFGLDKILRIPMNESDVLLELYTAAALVQALVAPQCLTLGLLLR